MKWYNNLILIAALALFFYLVGNFFPIKVLVPNFNNNTISVSEYYTIIIGGVSTFVTFLAVIIALFKEDIRKYWEFSKLAVSIHENKFNEVLNDSIKETQSLEAIKYHSRMKITNTGNISAMGIEIALESLTFSSQSYPNPQNIEIISRSLKWDGTGESKINLPPEGKIEVELLKLLAPEKQSSPEGAIEQIPCLLNIAEIDNPKHFDSGKWIASFAIFSTNSKPVRFSTEIEWNGKWEKRASEMNNNLNIELKG